MRGRRVAGRKIPRKRLVQRIQAAREAAREAAVAQAPPPPPKKRAKHHPWSIEEMMILRGAAKNRDTGRYDWKKASALLGAAGYVRTPAQCQCKFRGSCFVENNAASWPSLPTDPTAAAASPTWSKAQVAVHAEFLRLQKESARLSAVWTTQENAMKDTYKKHAKVLLAMRKCAGFID